MMVGELPMLCESGSFVQALRLVAHFYFRCGKEKQPAATLNVVRAISQGLSGNLGQDLVHRGGR
jgi:hypothetical protein